MKELLHDLMAAAGVGAAATCGLLGTLFALGMLMNGFRLPECLALLRSSMLAAGAAGLLLCAGALLRSESVVKKRIRENPCWKRHFYRFGLVPVVVVVSFEILAAAICIDYYLC